MSDDRQNEESESFEPDTLDEDAGDPAAAFDALRERVENLASDLTREMTTIRKGVEHALDHLDQRGAPIDYSGEIGRMSQDVAGLSERLAGIEQSPILRQGPEHYARVLERGGEGLVRTAAQQFQNESRDFQRAARELAEHTRSALTRRSQAVRVWVAAGCGVVVGALVLLLLPRFLPVAASSHVAALVMGQNRIDAGHAILYSADPSAAKAVSRGGWIYETNRKAVDECIAEMLRSGKEQRCAVVLPVAEKRRQDPL
ncbi:hypothetical protein IFT59_22015 [Rhizobium sp. CFBP 8752]|uniref:DUF6118 family protein n=1 Tax=Rhizobium sp. CFBP 8752 TaxID=2775301 RepID=UPI0017831D26|nr:DUF6118 family protein [Rhizobium sp. CFBP 8752]MBD8665921.1 hypothetical protein [Rhizobium sp. CFBP 8752]